MGVIITQFPTKTSFFEVYPQLISVFPDLDHKSEDDSKLMWYISLIVSPTSTYSNLTYSERIERASQELELTIDLEDEKIEKLVESFKNIVLTKKEKFLVA